VSPNDRPSGGPPGSIRVLLDQRVFLLDAKAYAQFTVALGQPPTENRHLRRLLSTKAVWDA